MSVQGFLYKRQAFLFGHRHKRNIIPLPYLFIDARTSVSDIQTVAQLARILWGEGGMSKIRACPYFGKCGNLRTVPHPNPTEKPKTSLTIRSTASGRDR